MFPEENKQACNSRVCYRKFCSINTVQIKKASKMKIYDQ